MINIYFGIYILISCSIIFFGFLKYSTLLNSLTITIVIFSLSVVTAVPHYLIFSSNTPADLIQFTIFVSLIYIIGLSLPFFIKTGFLSLIYRKFLIYLKLDNTGRASVYKTSVFYSFLLSSGIFYIILISHSGGGLLWITNPRDAYMDYRSGSGHFYAFTMWSLMFGYLYFLWFATPKYMSIGLLFFFSFLAYFLGSKGFILYFLIIFTFYWHFLVKPINNIYLIFFGVIIFSLFLGVQLLQGTANGFTDTIKYFIYFDTTAKFLGQFERLGFQYGSAFLGQFWEMVPRSLYPDKPYVYGQFIIHETLDPGMLEKGRARGTLKWTKYYLDFGIIGVFFVGFFSGIFKKISYDYFLKHRRNPFAFMIMMQVGIITIFNYTNILFFLILLILFLIWVMICGSYNRRMIIVMNKI
jgi:hypothetical protein